ncbi:hypothetical protein AOLI_G00037440 [Acnodon oligacanthus]
MKQDPRLQCLRLNGYSDYCPVHNSQETFSYVKNLKERQQTEGKLEYLVRWRPRAACGVKWWDSWVPEADLYKAAIINY